jgi:hypothetical protein
MNGTTKRFHPSNHLLEHPTNHLSPTIGAE